MGILDSIFNAAQYVKDNVLTEENLIKMQTMVNEAQAKKEAKREELITRLYAQLAAQNNSTVEKFFVKGSPNHIFDGEDLAKVAAERVLRDRYYDDYKLNQVKYR